MLDLALTISQVLATDEAVRGVGRDADHHG
jgi:hypothetical protein